MGVGGGVNTAQKKKKRFPKIAETTTCKEGIWTNPEKGFTEVKHGCKNPR